MGSTSTWRLFPSTFAAALLVSTSLAACGGGSGSKTTADQPKHNFKSPPVRIQINTAINTVAAGSFPEAIASVKAAARAVNDAGGINGHELVVSSCNTKADPNAEVACARQTVSDGAIASVGTIAFNDLDGYLTTLKKADIADVGPNVIGTEQAQYTNSFPITFNFGGIAECAGKAVLQQAGGNKVAAFITDTPTGALVGNFIAGASLNSGAKYVGTVLVPATVTDYTPYVQRVADENPDVVVGSMSLGQMQAFIASAYSTGHHWKFCSFISSTLGSLGEKLGAAAPSLYHGATIPPLGDADKSPGLKRYLAEMKAEEDAGDADARTDPNHYSATGAEAWLATQAFVDIAKQIPGTLTRRKFLAAISKGKFDGAGMVPAMDFNKPLGVGKGPFPRIFNDKAWLSKWSPDQKVFVTVPGSELGAIKALFGG
jgi:ABC-type branched-subunit amino acid transport system substrate-binding protein